MHRISKKSCLAIFLLGLSIVTAFAPVLSSPFINWDDGFHLKNPFFVGPVNIQILKNIFSQGLVNKVYVPLTLLSFCLEYNFLGTHPFIYHLNNLLLHYAVSALILATIIRLGYTWRVGVLTAFVFALHPLHVEPVAWVSGRKDVLYSFFYLLAVYQYLGYINHGRKADFSWSLLWGFLSILAKPMALSLPAILLLIDWFKGRRWTGKLLAEKALYLLYIIPLAWITFSLNIRVGEGSWTESLLIWSWSFVFYLRQFFFPFHFSLIYPLPVPVHIFSLTYGVSVLSAMFVLVFVWRYRHVRIVPFAFAYYFISIFFLFRYDGIAAGDNPVADRYAYLSVMGLCLLAARLMDRMLEKASLQPGNQKRFVRCCVGIVLLFLAVKTNLQSRLWMDSIPLWTNVIHRFPQVALAYIQRGNAFIEAGAFQQAENDYRAAADTVKKQARDALALARRMAGQGLYPEALEYVNRALKLDTQNVEARVIRSRIYMDLGRLSPALEDLSSAIDRRPRDAELYILRGMLYGEQGATLQALNDLTQAITLNPEDALGYHNRGVVHYRAGQNALALQDFNRVFSLNQRSSASYFMRGEVLFELGQYAPALLDYETVLRLDPHQVRAVYSRGRTYDRMGNYEKAMRDYRSYILAVPQSVDAWQAVARIERKNKNIQGALEAYHTLISFYPFRGDFYKERSLLWAETGQYTRAFRDALMAGNLGESIPPQHMEFLKNRILPLTR